METQPTPETSPSLLNGLNILLEGESGTGKTYSVGTLVDYSPHLEVFYLSLESGLESLLGYWTDRGLPIPPNLHWQYIRAPDYGFSQLAYVAGQINSLSNEALAKIQDPNKSKHNQLIKLLSALADFRDERTGENYGGVDTWGPSRVLVIDALTGVNNAALSLAVGAKPIRSLVDWGIAMDQIERLLRQLTEGCRCHFVLLSHIERETDQVLGGVKLTVGTLGAKLAPKIPPMFSDVILTAREGTKFTWNTANTLATLKTRNLEIRDGQNPSFKPILDKWTSRGGKFTSTVKT